MNPGFWLMLAGALASMGAGTSRGLAAHRGAGRRRGRGASAVGGRWLAGAAGGGAAMLAVALGGEGGVWAAAPLAVAAGGAAEIWRRRQPADRSAEIEPRAAALLLDLLASALDAGAPPEHAIALVAAAAAPGRDHRPAGGVDRSGVGRARSWPADGDLARAAVPLARVGRLLELGADPASAWAELESTPAYDEAAAAARRCASSGSRLAASLHRVAAELRQRHQQDALAKADRVGVWSMLPLGLCFLPAFVCLGVVPVVLGVGREALRGVG